MNKIILMGRLTRDPEIRYSQSANPIAIARFSIAVNRIKVRADGISADFFNCVSFGRLAEFAEKYLHQGTKILLTGSVGTGFYDKNSVQMPFFEITADDIEFAESKKMDQANNPDRTVAEIFDADNNIKNEDSFDNVANNHNGSSYNRSNSKKSGRYNKADDDGFIYVPDTVIDELPFN